MAFHMKTQKMKVLCKWIGIGSGDEWELEKVWDNVCVGQLDEIGKKPNREWHPVNYSCQDNICVAVVENVNTVLVRHIIDWSHLDDYVWSQQVVWSGSFLDCHRILQLLESDSRVTNSIEMRTKRFDLNLHLRQPYIVHRRNYPVVATIAVVDSFPTIVIPVGTGDGDGEVDISLCPVCQYMLFEHNETIRLPCNHRFQLKVPCVRLKGRDREFWLNVFD